MGSGKIKILRPFLVGSVAISHAGNGSMLIVKEAELRELIDAIERAIAAEHGSAPADHVGLS